MSTSKTSNRSFRSMYLIILVQFAIIIFLLGIISNEYLSNYWMQVWIAGKAPMLAFLINGQLDSLLVGIAAALTLRFLKNMSAQTRTKPVNKPTIILAMKELARMEKRVLGEHYKPIENSPEDLLRDLEEQEA